MASKIDTAPKRAKLKPGNEPVWEGCGPKQYIGYRKALTPERCAWYGRAYVADKGSTGKPGYITSRLLPGDAEFEVARQAARDFAEMATRGVVAAKTDTVLAACLAYVDNVRDIDRRPVAADAMARAIRRAVEGTPLGATPLAELQAPMFAAWRVEMSKGLASATVNREMVPLRAALRWAIGKDLLASDKSFAQELKPIKGADKARDVYLTREQRQALLQALEAQEPTLAKLARACTLLPLRPGAVAALTVADLRGGQLRIAKDKTLQADETRTIGLPATALAFLAEQARGKLPSAPLLPNAEGGHWESKRWFQIVKAACKAAKMPKGTVLYSLRHSLLTDLANGGAPLAAVAQLAGTSIGQLQLHYYQGADATALAAIERLAV